MTAIRRDYGFRIVNLTNNQIVLSDKYGLSVKELERMKAKWKRRCKKMGWNYFLITTQL